MVSSAGLTSAPVLTDGFSSGEEQQEELPQLMSWSWTSIRRRFAHRRLCKGCEHFYGAFGLCSCHVNCNLGPGWFKRRVYKLLVSLLCLASMPDSSRTVLDTQQQQFPASLSSFRAHHTAARSHHVSHHCHLPPRRGVSPLQGVTAGGGGGSLPRPGQKKWVHEKVSLGSLFLRPRHICVFSVPTLQCPYKQCQRKARRAGQGR